MSNIFELMHQNKYFKVFVYFLLKGLEDGVLGFEASLYQWDIV